MDTDADAGVSSIFYHLSISCSFHHVIFDMTCQYDTMRNNILKAKKKHFPTSPCAVLSSDQRWRPGPMRPCSCPRQGGELTKVAKKFSLDYIERNSVF